MSMDEISAKLAMAKRDLKVSYGLSGLNATLFSLNIACAAFFPFSFWTVVNVIVALWILRSFRAIVRHQLIVMAAIAELNKLKGDNVWTPNE